MGFNKRIINRESIIATPQDRIGKLFDVDALVMDKWASRFLQLHLKGYDKEHIVNILDDNFKDF